MGLSSLQTLNDFLLSKPTFVFSFLHGRAATPSPITPIIPIALTPQTRPLRPPVAVGASSLRSAPLSAPLPHCSWRALPLFGQCLITHALILTLGIQQWHPQLNPYRWFKVGETNGNCGFQMVILLLLLLLFHRDI